jgi:hypothetical protein
MQCWLLMKHVRNQSVNDPIKGVNRMRSILAQISQSL